MGPQLDKTLESCCLPEFARQPWTDWWSDSVEDSFLGNKSGFPEWCHNREGSLRHTHGRWLESKTASPPTFHQGAEGWTFLHSVLVPFWSLPWNYVICYGLASIPPAWAGAGDVKRSSAGERDFWRVMFWGLAATPHNPSWAVCHLFIAFPHSSFQSIANIDRPMRLNAGWSPQEDIRLYFSAANMPP